MRIDIRNLLPDIYTGIKETDVLADIENNFFDQIEKDYLKVLNSQFVATADSDGLSMYENMLGIVADPVIETDDFRRSRIINRLSTSPPFTYRFLCIKLDEMIGRGLWQAYVDTDTYTLTVESVVKEQIWLEEILVTMTRIKPCNMVFINKPLLPIAITESELIEYDQEESNYRLGVKCVLGKKPFRSLHEKGAVKMETAASITKENLLMLADHLISKIAKVRLNGVALIDDWQTKALDETTLCIEYRVDLSYAIDTLTKIELLDSDGIALTDATVYVPIIEPIIVKHKIKIKEGLDV